MYRRVIKETVNAALDPTLSAGEFSFSVVQGGPFYSLRKALGLVPEKGLGLAPRILAIILLTWAPVVIGALLEGVAFIGGNQDPLLRHFGIHTRFLIAVPLLLLAEFPMERNVRMAIRHFVQSGIVRPEQRPDLAAVLRSCERLRDAIWGRLFVLAAMVAVIFLGASGSEVLQNHELAWVTTGSSVGAHTTFAGWWFIYVSRPVYVALLAVWLWRLIVVWSLMAKISKLDLRLVPGHPDRAGGLAFLDLIVRACNPLMIANSVVLAGRWAHDVKYHGLDVQGSDLQSVLAVYVFTVLLLFLGPFLMFSKTLLRFKHRATLQYAVLTGEEGRLVDEKWVLRKDVGENPLLGPPEIGPMADAITLYQTVAKIRPFPLGKEALIGLVFATILPILPVFALQIPLKDLLLKLGAGLL